MMLQDIASKYHLLADTIAVSILTAGQFDNHLWRIIVTVCCLYVYQFVIPTDDSPFTNVYFYWSFFLGHVYVIFKIPYLRRRQPRLGCVFITGADSGMGQATVLHLSKLSLPDQSYDIIFAGAYNAPETEKRFRELLAVNNNEDALRRIVVVPIDVTSDKSVQDAAKVAEAAMSKISTVGLTAVINYHGIAFNGPTEYMPIKMYTRQHDVNFIGNVRMVQSFLPLVKFANKNTPKDYRTRFIFCGTGGGSCSPCPSLLSAYMSSKFALEAMCQSLRMELHMLGHPIDCCVINPGFVKPTMLMEEGVKLTRKMWEGCREKLEGSTVAEDEYGPMMNHFMKYSNAVPGEHVSAVARAADDALTAFRPKSSYKVGIDSKLAPLVGMMPTGARELISRHGMYGILSPAGTVSKYKV